MPDIYDIDTAQQAPDLLPPDKRDAPTKSLLSALLSAVQWARDWILSSYKDGAVAPNWSPGSYNAYDQVIYNKMLWYNTVAGNTDTPGTTETWVLLQTNLVGVKDRIKYNGIALVLEYALNREYGGVFRQPGAGISDIYFTKLSPVITGWRIGESTGTAMGADTSDESVGGALPFVRINNFQINIPVALYAATTEQAIRNFVNTYIPSSLNFTIVTY